MGGKSQRIQQPIRHCSADYSNPYVHGSGRARI
jgi:hypothetical protein